jgi:hypothetical protein
VRLDESNFIGGAASMAAASPAKRSSAWVPEACSLAPFNLADTGAWKISYDALS